VTVDEHLARARRDDAADDVDQRGLAGAVGPEQREDLAALDLEVDAFQRLQARGVALFERADGKDGRNALPRCREITHVANPQCS
jgi:hypothetical protein